MTNAQPPLLLVAGPPLPESGELPVKLPGGATVSDPPEPGLTAGAGLAVGAGWAVAGAALVGVGAGTDETCETCET